MKSVGLPPRKVSGFLLEVKDNLRLKTLQVYSIPYECGKVYIGQTGCSIDTSDIHLEHPEKSAMVEYSIDQGNASNYMTLPSSPSNLDSEQVTKPLICSLIDHRIWVLHGDPQATKQTLSGHAL
jgi:hypothetical protein